MNHKILLVLGLLLKRPLYGHELYQILRAHGELYADLKKGNLYYLLEHLTLKGHLQVQLEGEAHATQPKHVCYLLTEQGKVHFVELLHTVLLTYEPVHTGISSAVVFLSYLTPDEGLILLEQRYQIVLTQQEEVKADLGRLDTSSQLMHIAGDHLLSFIDAELIWITRSLDYLRSTGWANQMNVCPRPTFVDNQK